MSELAELAAAYGTPLYVYRTDRLDAAVARLRTALPQHSRLYYSVKANPHPGVVHHLTGLGLGAEVSSSGEWEVARPAPALYTGPGKTDAEIRAALRTGVRLFSVESAGERARLSRAADAVGIRAEYLIRVNGPDRAAATGLRMSGPRMSGPRMDGPRMDGA